MRKWKSGSARTIERILKVATLSVPLVETISIFLGNNVMPDWLRYFGIVIAVSGDVVFVISVLTMNKVHRYFGRKS